MYSTTISSELISQPEIEALIMALQETTRKRIELQESFVIVTEDINVSAMMDALKDTLAAPVKAKANGHKKAKGAKKPDDGMTSHTRRNVESGEILSTQALHKAITVNDALANTVWEDSKMQRFVVSGGELIKEPQS